MEKHEEAIRSTRCALAVAIGAVAALCLLCFWHERLFFWHHDFASWYSPYFVETVRAWREGEWPILNLHSWTAGQMAGEYQAGTFSLFHQACVVLVWSLPLSLPARAALFSALYLALLAAGTVLLARRRGLRPPLAVGVALTTAFNGWMIQWGAKEWSVALSGFAWVPWAWWAFELARETSRPRVRWLLPSLFVYLTVSSGSPFAVVMLGIVTGWMLLRDALGGSWRWSAAAPLLAAWALGLALSAPSWLMLVEYARLSRRAEWGFRVHRAWMVPWRAWLALGYPSFVTNWREFSEQVTRHECVELAGALVPAAAVLALLGRKGRAAWIHHRAEWLLLGAAMLLCSLPLVGSFRCSFRFLPLFYLVLGLRGAEALEELGPQLVVRWALLFSALATAAAVFAESFGSLAFAGWQFVILLAWWLAGRRAAPRWRAWGSTAAIAALVLATYLSLPSAQDDPFHPFTENLRQNGPLDARRLYLSLYTFEDLKEGMKSPPGWGAIVRPGNTALLADLHFLNGYSSFNAQGVPTLFEIFGNVTRETGKDLLSPARAGLLDLLGVDGIILAPRMEDLATRLGPEWKPVFRSLEARVYHREPARAAAVKALAVLESRPEQKLAQPPLRLVWERRLSVVVDVGESSPAGPAAVAFPRPYYPGYEASLDGRPLPVVACAGVVPVVALPAGAHGRLELRYRPWSLRLGAWIAFAGVSVFLLSTLRLAKRRSLVSSVLAVRL